MWASLVSDHNRDLPSILTSRVTLSAVVAICAIAASAAVADAGLPTCCVLSVSTFSTHPHGCSGDVEVRHCQISQFQRRGLGAVKEDADAECRVARAQREVGHAVAGSLMFLTLATAPFPLFSLDPLTTCDGVLEPVAVAQAGFLDLKEESLGPGGVDAMQMPLLIAAVVLSMCGVVTFVRFLFPALLLFSERTVLEPVAALELARW